MIISFLVALSVCISHNLYELMPLPSTFAYVSDPVALQAVLTQIKYFGQTPPQLLEHEHPRRLPQSKCSITFDRLVDHLCNFVFDASRSPGRKQSTRQAQAPCRVKVVDAWMLLSPPPAAPVRNAALDRAPEGVCAVFYMSNSAITVYQDFRVACHAFSRDVRKMPSW